MRTSQASIGKNLTECPMQHRGIVPFTSYGVQVMPTKNFWASSMPPSLQYDSNDLILTFSLILCLFQVLSGKYLNSVCSRFRISPSAFFQVNTKATEVLYSIVREWCALPPKGDSASGTFPIPIPCLAWSSDHELVDVKTTVLDICCGTGTIGLTMGKDVDQIVGIEMVESAIEDAKYNAALNNVRFVIECHYFR